MVDKHNTADFTALIKNFITDRLQQSAMAGFVVGLSGGIDSSVSVALAVEAVGSDKVMGVSMPYRTSSNSSRTDAARLAEKLGIELHTVDISPMIDAYFDSIDESNRLRAGNKMARERMAILFDIAAKNNQLVLGTGNRTEICLGYTTWYGDSACSINPIGDLYKTEIRQMAPALGIPDKIIAKTPSADLWEGQTDESEIGVQYEQIDAILIRLIDDNIQSLETLTSEGFNIKDINRVISLINRNWFKRTMPEIASLNRPLIPQLIQIQT
ncbi:MAG: NAD(+) synthetase [Candidatus Zixiibacteriota bacterium]|nr:MAG: NAD(+) synthetase [candidate division Zixibacteria bacterium]